jgi:hypothetical protein
MVAVASTLSIHQKYAFNPPSVSKSIPLPHHHVDLGTSNSLLIEL